MHIRTEWTYNCLFFTLFRCRRESKLAVQLSSAKKCNVIVVAVEKCSRPRDLKQYLYLDFIDQTKISMVWKKLEETIGK